MVRFIRGGARRRPKRSSRILVTLRLIAATVLAGVLVAGLALPVVGGLGLAARNTAERFDSLPTALRDDGRPPQRSVIVAADGTRIANLYLQNRTIVPLTEIAAVAQHALIAIEDNRFYSHHGVDVRGTTRALVSNVLGGGTSQGGSTLTQQYVKQVLLYSATTKNQQAAATADTVGRKVREAKLAVALENELTKAEILKRYLNIAYFGSGAYGIETASLTYFGVHAKDLDLPSSALLAGLVQSPYGNDPHRHPDRALARRTEVLKAMFKYGYIDEGQELAALRVPLNLTKQPEAPANGCTEALMPDSGFFCAYVRNYLTNVLHLTQQQLFQGGLTIRTTIDPTIQRKVMAALTASVPKANKNAAVMDVVQPGTGDIQAMAVNRTYGDAAGDKTRTTINLAVKPTANAGSTFKVFTLAAALEKHVPFAYRLPSPASYKSPLFDHTFTNDTISETGPYSLDRATVQSVNTYYIQLLESPYFNGDLSLPVQISERMGMSVNSLSADEATQIIRNRQASFTLGALSLGASPLDLAGVAATLAAHGRYCQPTPVLSITTPSGQRLPVGRQKCREALSPDVADGVTDILRHVPTKDAPWSDFSTASDAALDPSHPGAGKTGTTNENSSVWFLGYTPALGTATAVFDPVAPSHAIFGLPGVTGPVSGSFSAKVWGDAMRSIVSGAPSWTWPAPKPAVVNGDAKKIPCVYGDDSATARERLTKQGFTVIDGPQIYSTAYSYGSVVGISPDCGSTRGRGVRVTLTYSLGISPVPTTTPPPTTAPTYTVPTYTAPTYTAPTYTAPTYTAPTYPTPPTTGPSYTVPTYTAPSSTTPPTTAPTTTAPTSTTPLTSQPAVTTPSATTPSPTTTRPPSTTPSPTTTRPPSTTPSPTTTRPPSTTPSPTTTRPPSTTPSPTTTRPSTTRAPTTTPPRTRPSTSKPAPTTSKPPTSRSASKAPQNPSASKS